MTPAAASLRVEKDGGLSPSMHAFITSYLLLHWDCFHGIAMTFRPGISSTFDEPNNVPHCHCFPEPHRPALYIRNHGMEGQAPSLVDLF